MADDALANAADTSWWPEWAKAHDPEDIWIGECGCFHLLVGEDCPCGPTIRAFDVHHNCPHTDERVIVDGR